MSLTVTVSAPPRAFRSTCSRPLVSIVMPATSRTSSRRFPYADRSIFSGTLAPLKTIVSVPDWPSTTSLPSPGSHTNESSPAPMRTTSLPRLPSIESFPEPPTSVSAPDPPTRRSSPEPPSIVVGMLSVKIPLDSSIVTESSPLLASTSMSFTSARLKLNSAVPSLTMSTSSVPGWPFWRRSVIASFALVPATASTPFWSFGSLICDALVMSSAGSGARRGGRDPDGSGDGHGRGRESRGASLLESCALIHGSPSCGCVVECQGRRSSFRIFPTT